MKNKVVDDLLKTHRKLTHSEHVRVISHVQRDTKEWVINTILIEDCGVPFKYKRKKCIKTLKASVLI